MPSRQPSWQHLALVKSRCYTAWILGQEGSTWTLLPGHFTLVSEEVAEPMATCCTDRGLQQGSGSGSQTHHAHKVLQISTFLPKRKGFLLYGQHFFNLFDPMEGRGASDPSHGLTSGQRAGGGGGWVG